MDNDNKIAQTPVIVTQFLGDNLSELPDTGQNAYYNLEDAFAKTRQHHSKKIFFILLIMVAVTAGIAYLLSYEIKKSSREVSIAINAIDDLNLKNILDVVEKTKEAHERAGRRLETLKTNRQNELSAAESAYNQTLNSIDAMQGGRSKKAALAEKAAQDYETEKQRVMAVYETDIQEAEAEFAKQESNLTAFDANRVKEAEAQQELINNQKRLFDLEKRTLIKEYEGRITALENYTVEQRAAYEKANLENIKAVQKSYEERIRAIDPTFKDRKAARIFENLPAEPATPEYIPFSNTPENIPAYVPVKKENYTDIAAGYRDMLYLLEKLRTVPFENEIPHYLTAVENLLQKAGSNSETALAQSTSVIRNQYQTITAQEKQLNDKNDLIAALLKTANPRIITDYYAKLDALMTQRSIAAIILNADNPEQMQIRVNPATGAKDGVTGYVFRNETNYIGEVIFISNGNDLSVRMKPAENSETPPVNVFKVMDVIFLSKG